MYIIFLRPQCSDPRFSAKYQARTIVRPLLFSGVSAAQTQTTMATASSSNLTLAHEADPEKTSDNPRNSHIPSINSDPERDIEKGDPGVKDNNETDQGDLDRRRTEPENDLVAWDGPDDKQNPQNWPKSKKYLTTVLYSTCTFCITFASSVFSTATEVTAREYGVSVEVMTLGTSLFVFVRSFLLAGFWHPYHSFSLLTHPRVSLLAH